MDEDWDNVSIIFCLIMIVLVIFNIGLEFYLRLYQIFQKKIAMCLLSRVFHMKHIFRVNVNLW